MDFIIPLSQLQRAMSQIIDPIKDNDKHIIPDFISMKFYNSSMNTEFQRNLPKKLMDKFIELEWKPFKRLLIQNQRKVWFSDEAGQEFGFDAKTWIYA
jgi:hypothetical protein